jgi:glycosyltransferase involved in cell wall biosynthesis
MKSKVRVLHIVADPATGAILVAPIARCQAECGYSVEFACAPGEYLDRLRGLGFPVTVVPIARRLIAWSHIVAVYQLWRLMRSQHYHVVHTHNAVASFLGRIAAALAGVPVIIYHLRGSRWDSPNFMTRLISMTADRVAAQWTTHTFTINCSDASDLVELGIAPTEKVTCLHCGSGGVDTQRFDPSRFTAGQKSHLKVELGIQNTDLVVGFIGRLVQEKGVFELLTAFQEVAVALPNAKLLLVGGTLASDHDQVTIQKLKSLVSSSDELSEQVIFTGFRRDIPELIAVMDVVVLPSYHQEGFGMVLAEAAAMARPVVATNSRGAREAVVPETTGLLVPIGDTDALRDAILRLASDPDLRHRMGEEARRRALERFDEGIVFQTIKDEYARLLQEKGLSMPEPFPLF